MALKTVLFKEEWTDYTTLPALLATKLGETLGWSVNDCTVAFPNSDIYLTFGYHLHSSTRHMCYVVGNSSSSTTLHSEYNYTGLGISTSRSSGTAQLYIHYLITDYSVAIGVSSDNSGRLSMAFATTTEAKKSLLYLQYFGTSNVYGIYLFTNDALYQKNYYSNSCISGTAVAMVRMPDIANGGAFQDVYYVYNTPYLGDGTKYTIGGKTFYQLTNISTKYGGLAVAE